MSYLLWAAGGGRFDAVSTASKSNPSAGAIYPERLYVMAADVEGMVPGVYQYFPASHSLKKIKEGDLRREAVKGSPYAGFVRQAPVTVVLAAEYGWTSTAFGERGRSLYVPLDVGHVSQTLRLAAAAAGLVGGIAGEFDHVAVKELLGIPEEPLLLIALGYPK